MNRIQALLQVIALLFIPEFLFAQDRLVLSLQDCLDRALESNPQLELNLLEQEKREYQYIRERRYFIPEISGYARYFQYLDDKPVYIFPENLNDNLSGPVQLGAPLNFYTGVTINQHLLDARMFGSKPVRGNIERLNGLQKEMKEDEIRYEVIKTFYQAQILEQSSELLDFNLDRLDKLQRVTQSSVDAGAASATAITEMEIRREEVLLSRQELENRRAQLYSYLRFLCNIPASTEIALVFGSENSVPTEPLTNADSSGIREYELLELQKQLGTENPSNLSGTLPTLDFFAAFQWLQQEGYGDLFTSEGSWFNQHMIGLQLNVPIINPESRRSKSQESRINRDIIEKQQELVVEKTAMERQKSINDLALAREDLRIAEKKVSLYEMQFEKAGVRYEQQFSSLAELLESEEKFRSAKIELQRKKIAYFMAILEVYRTFGMLESFQN